MNTGISKPSKTSKRLSTIAAITGSTAIIALAIAFVTVDFSGFFVAPSFTVDASAIDALEPIRSDPRSDQDGTNGDNGSGNSDNDGNNGNYGLNDDDRDDAGSNGDGNGAGTGDGDGSDKDRNGRDGFGDVDSDRYADHGLPCLDPNCPIHHGGNGNDDGSGNGSDDGTDGNGNGSGDGSRNDDNDRPPVNISAEEVSFKANLAVYVNQEDAEETLSEYVDSINNYFDVYPDGKIYLVGCIAKTSKWSITETDLSEARAETVKQTLVGLGIDEDKLVAVGLGINDPWRQDEWSLGYFDESTAKLNRHVWLLPDQYTEQVKLVETTKTYIDKVKESEKTE